jgi:hypothetical protein
MDLAINMRLQRGQVFLVTLLILIIGASGLAYYFIDPNSQLLRRNERASAAFAQAKAALIGYAASHNTRPGALPCPDTNDDGYAEDDPNLFALTSTLPSAPCPSNLGRLPWKTLGLSDLRDGSGERLWYGISQNHRNTGAINSDTAGQITVDGAVDNVAVLIAPGPTVSDQVRNGPGSLLASNYLEGGNEVGAASPTPAYLSGSTNTRNDILASISRTQLLPPVELRVAREVSIALRNYYNANRYYPFAAPLTGTNCTNGLVEGRLPVGSCIPAPTITLPNLTTIPSWPSWFSPNQWNRVILYAVAPRCTPKIDSTTTTTTTTNYYPWPTNTGGCFPWLFGFWICPLTSTTTTTTYNLDSSALDCNNTVTPNWITVGASNNIHAILLPSGPAIPTQTRSCTNMGNCLEDAENINGNQIFVKPIRSSVNNDNLVVVAP